PSGHLPADPRPAGAPARQRAGRVLAARARRRADRAADRDVRDGADGGRALATEGLLVRRGLATAQRSGRTDAARVAATDGTQGARGADYLDAAGQRHAARRPRVAGESDRSD